ncbi:hypothetical protein FB451DRAFT_771984 [Mycena latifolia]|nr:hypothetical protein FB451DRAFT_771984 [Mycena latifolia]
MPIFSSCTGFQIHDGNFYEVSGDVNFQTQHLMIGDYPQAQACVSTGVGSTHSARLSEPQDDWAETSHHESAGVARSLHRRAAPLAPYNASFRPRLLPRDSEAPLRESRPEWNQPAISSPISLPSLNHWMPSSDSRSQHPFKYQHFEPHQNYPMLHPQDHGASHYSLPTADIPDYEANDSVPCLGPARADAGPSFHGGTFITAQNVNDYRPGEIGINILHRGVALEALHDSADSFPQPKCHPETREKMLDDLWEYATGLEPRDTILWLHGPAGAGKSAIMWSLCERLQAAGRLGGTFFFKRGHPTRGNAKALFSTIAYRLALRVPWLKGPISQTVENDPSLVVSTPEIQFQQLILKPCQSITNYHPAIIIIDGLDECDGHQMQQEILRILGNSVPQHHRSLRILVASRPEAHISEMTSNWSAFQALNVEQSFEDVRKYLLDEFSRIHDVHPKTMAHVPRPWPSSEELKTLVYSSSGHFIYASTVIKFADDASFRPTERLTAVIGNRTEHKFDSPFGALDQLYIQILSTVPSNTPLVGILRVLAYFPDAFSAHHIDQLLDLEAGDTVLVLRSLHSLLCAPETINMRDDDPTTWVRIGWHHASFGDFLLDPTRGGKFYVGTEERCMDLARSILKALSSATSGEQVGISVGGGLDI